MVFPAEHRWFRQGWISWHHLRRGISRPGRTVCREHQGYAMACSTGTLRRAHSTGVRINAVVRRLKENMGRVREGWGGG